MDLKVIISWAADIMEERGWACGHFEEYPGGPVCAIGALNIARGAPPEERPQKDALVAIASALSLDTSEDWGTTLWNVWTAVASWSNKADGPTVVAGLRQVAAGLPESGQPLLPDS